MPDGPHPLKARGFFNTECMKFLEKDLEEIIFNADRNELVRRGLIISGKIFRQLRIGNYGIADLVTVKRVTPWDTDEPILIIRVYELKKEKISMSAFLQVIGYVKGIESYIKQRGFSFDVRYEIIVIGKQVDNNSSVCYLPDIFPTVRFYKYKYDVDGLRFYKINNYRLTKEGFKI